MELESYGPIDRLFEVFPSESAPIPENVPADVSSGIKTWQWVVLIAVLAGGGLIVWKYNYSNKKQKQ